MDKRGIEHIASRTTMILFVLASPAVAGEFADVCLERDKLSGDACQCIEDGLMSALGEEDAGIYLRVSLRYFDIVDAGASRGDAWDTAVREEAERLGIGFTELLSRTNEMGTTHRDIHQSCR